MTLETTLQSLTAQAFRTLSSVLVPGLLVHHALPVYDPQTGRVVASPPALYDVAVLKSQYRREEIDGVLVLWTDRKLCIEQATLPVTPQNKDTVEIDGQTWSIEAVGKDTADLVWVLQGRAAGEGGA
jgi:hypothetical protein